MRKSAASIALMALLMLNITACGWHLRGSGGNTLSFEHIHVSTSNPRSELVRQLKRQLAASDVTVVENATEADFSLVILKENSQRRTATVSGSARVSERSLIEKAEFLVLNKKGGQVVPLTHVMVERVFEYNENNVLATDDEARMLKREMRGELARQIYNRLRQLKITAKTVNAPQG